MGKVHKVGTGRTARFAISYDGLWMPGVYASEEAAWLAFEFCDDVLVRLRNAAVRLNDGLVTEEMMRASTERVCEGCSRARGR